MKTIQLSIIVLFALMLPVNACIWDRDTYAMEKKAFPEIVDLISGNFVRHSNEYYEWRIKDREEKLKLYKDSLNLYDDLAVAYSKLGNDKKAIELMFLKDKIKPNLYETYANLGTFYIHDNQLEKGIEYIDKAIEINPDAHFGREIYQKYVVQYILEKRKEGELSFPIYMNNENGSNYDFYNFLISKQGKDESNYLSQGDLKKAIKGVSGMMRFGNYDSPVLLEILGDLLSEYWYNEQEDYSTQRLSSMAYLKAGMTFDDKRIRNKYNEKAESVLADQEGESLNRIKRLLKKELQKSEKTSDDIQSNEIKWIKENKNVDEEFDEKYYEKKEPFFKSSGLYYLIFGLLGIGIIIILISKIIPQK